MISKGSPPKKASKGYMNFLILRSPLTAFPWVRKETPIIWTE